MSYTVFISGNESVCCWPYAVCVRHCSCNDALTVRAAGRWCRRTVNVFCGCR